MTGGAESDEAASVEGAWGGGGPLGWVLLPPGRVPQRWHRRGRQVVLVPLVADELPSVLAGQPAAPELDERDEQLVQLAARGATVAQMAQAVRLSTRGVGYRLAGLRDRFGAATTAELVAHLAAQGFPLAETGNATSEETDHPPANAFTEEPPHHPGGLGEAE